MDFDFARYIEDFNQNDDASTMGSKKNCVRS